MWKEYSTEIKVGALVFIALVLAAVFLWLLGDYTPIGRTYNIYVTYNFAGGVELGTPVRLSGIKVGKVTRISFLPPSAGGSAGSEVSLKLKLNISKTAEQRIRADSKFYINQAGIIGERYVEITAGSAGSPVLKPDELVRGVDPPRFDQMLSQGMDVFGQLSEIIGKNREGLEAAASSLAQAGKLLNEIVSKLSPEDVGKLRDILDHLDKASADLEILTRQLREDLGPTLTETRRTMQSARPVIEHADKLLADLDNAAQEIRDLPESKKAEIRKVLERMTKTTSQLEDVIARMDAFTAMMQDQYSDLDRAKIEKILRQFFQEEGIRINVGEVKVRSKQGPGR